MTGSRIVAAQIKPNSKKGPLVENLEDGTMLLYVRAPAVEGKANKAAEDLLSALCPSWVQKYALQDVKDISVSGLFAVDITR